MLKKIVNLSEYRLIESKKNRNNAVRRTELSLNPRQHRYILVEDLIAKWPIRVLERKLAWSRIDIGTKTISE
jgi:hypothetical protein